MNDTVYFKAGAFVPEWLFSVSPLRRTAFRPSLIFNVDCAVVDVGGSFWVLPMGESDSVISATDDKTALTEIAAASKTVRIVIKQEVHGNDGGEDDAEVSPLVPLVPIGDTP